MKKVFNINEYTRMHVMHCKTKDDAKIFLNVLNELGYKWCTGKSYLDIDYYDSYGSRTCYRFIDGSYSDYDYYKDGFIILEFDDFDWGEYDKAFSEEQALNDFISEFIIN